MKKAQIVLTLISCIKDRPILWDKRDTKFHNRILSNRAWKDLARIIGTTSERAKKKWKNLRDTFLKELKKNLQSRPEADDDVEPEYYGTWPYYESMTFLTQMLKTRKSRGNMVEDVSIDTTPTNDNTKSNSMDLSESSNAILEVNEEAYTESLIEVAKVKPLIKAIQERPILWDKRNKMFYNRSLSYRTWKELARMTGTSIERAKRKWKTLRDTFLRELKKVPQPLPGADVDDKPKYTGTWPFYESMSFLTVILEPQKKRSNNILEYDSTETVATYDKTESILVKAESADAAFEEIMYVDVADNGNSQFPEMTLLQEIPQSANFLEDPSPTASLTDATQIRQNINGLEVLLDTEREEMNMNLQDQSDDTDVELLWFRSLLPYVNQLPPLNKLRFRTKMQELLVIMLSNPSQSSPSTTFNYS